jgi:putative endopeptidase
MSHYLCFHAVNMCAPHLSDAFVNTHFEFHEKVLSGTTEIRPRWKRALSALESALGDALGQLYVSKYFKVDAKERALRIVGTLIKIITYNLRDDTFAYIIFTTTITKVI